MGELWKTEATGDCATCSFWKKKASPIKGKLIPGGSGKCTRKEGLCDNPKPKDPHPGRQRGAKKERDLRPQVPETSPTAPVNGSHEVSLDFNLP